MKTPKLAACVLAVALSTLSAQGSATVISYNAVVTFSQGPNAGPFALGAPVVISYDLDPLVIDANPDPQRGYYFDAVRSMSVSFPTLGIFANTGPAAEAQTANDIPSGPNGEVSDQVEFRGGPIISASLLQGIPITLVLLTYLSEFRVPPPLPSMLSSDALPLTSLPMIESWVTFNTSAGITFVDFAASPVPELPTQFLFLSAFVLLAANLRKRNRAVAA